MKKFISIVILMFLSLNSFISLAQNQEYKLSESEILQIKSLARKYKNDDFIKTSLVDYMNIKLSKSEKGTKSYVFFTELVKKLNEKSDLSINITIISDKRCSDCQTDELIKGLKEAENTEKIKFLSNAKFEIKDFSDVGVKDILKNNEITRLPAVLLDNRVDDLQFDSYLKETKLGMYSLELGSKFDPFAEICDNKVDDNGDNLIDCLDKTCSGEFKCAKKVNKPLAELYVMSYCPYGLQAEKGYLEVMNKLGKVADIKIKMGFDLTPPSITNILKPGKHQKV